MEAVKHLWNVNQFMTKLKNPLVTELQIFYMQKCKKFSSSVELPEQNFGPSIMCSHCGSLWSTVDHQVRIVSGKRMSKSVKKIVQCVNENPDQKIPKVRATLAQKSIKNEMNRLVIKCSVCSKNTELPFEKKGHLKPIKLNNLQTETPQSNHKKKKRRYKDKTAGLNISGCMPVSQSNKKDNNKTPTISPISQLNKSDNRKVPTISPLSQLNKRDNHKTPISVMTPKIISSNKNLSTSSKKRKKLNIERLKHIMENKSTTPTKRKSIQSFLAELY